MIFLANCLVFFLLVIRFFLISHMCRPGLMKASHKVFDILKPKKKGNIILHT